MVLQCLRNAFSLIHSHFAGQKAWLISKFFGTLYNLTIHANEIFCPDGLTKSMLNDALYIVTISKFNLKLIEKNFGVPSEKIHVIHCGVEISKKASSDLPLKGDSMKGSAFRIAAVGRLVPKKGFQVLLEALGKLQQAEKMDFFCDIVGDGPERKNIEKIRKEMKLENKVRLHGHRFSEETLCVIERSDILILPCITGKDGDTDGIPVVLMEAMSRGVAVISTKLSGIPELIENEKEGDSWHVVADASGHAQWLQQDGEGGAVTTVHHYPEVSWARRMRAALIAAIPLEKYL